MAIISSVNKEAQEKREKDALLLHKYENRITITRFGKEAFDNADYAVALSRYKEYLQVVVDFKESGEDIYSLKTGHFIPEQDLTEMLMISQIYLELARIFDAVPKYREEVQKCMDQFLHFTTNQPYQVINSELLRKHIKRSNLKNFEIFSGCYQQIAIQSKKCYIVTFCYGTDHPVTLEYRALKEWLLNYRLGQEFVRFYYLHSSSLVEKWQDHPAMHFLGRYLFSPLLKLFSKTLLRRIIK
jgi:hypothetical protein